MALNDYESSIMNTYVQGDKLNILVGHEKEILSKEPHEIEEYIKQVLRAMRSMKLDQKILKTK